MILAAQSGILLFAHGARDPQWAEPFLRIAERVRAAASDSAVELAYLESMKPTLKEGVERLIARGVTRIRVVPLFLGPGEHLRRDVPGLIREVMNATPGLDVELAEPAGADEGVVAAIAAYCLKP
jgi:sirohydrochlorin cobaltochelatase